MDIVNDTEEEIVIPPGEAVRIHGERQKVKSTASRREVFTVSRTGTDPMDSVTFITCEDCGDKVPADVMDAGAHEC